jgi:predicted nucleic acid-binding protein
MKRVFVDTSGWYAYIRADDPDHASVRAVMSKWEGRLVTTNYVFDEVITLARARLGHSQAVRVGAVLKNSDVVNLVRVLPEDEEDAWGLFVRHHDKLFSFTDCTSFSAMRRLGLSTAIAVDRDFVHAGFSMEPSS